MKNFENNYDAGLKFRDKLLESILYISLIGGTNVILDAAFDLKHSMTPINLIEYGNAAYKAGIILFLCVGIDVVIKYYDKKVGNTSI